ncbi:MAG: hypothetical protein CMJ19_15605 [Phycisphaeraceae bacterium]|nr:hypothetical protein [Phycisphaeraceae bacterium]
MTIKIFEVVALLILVILSLFIWQRSFTQNIKRLVYRLLRLVLTYGVGYFAFKWILSQGHGPIIAGLGATVAGFVTLFILGLILKPKPEDENAHRSLPNAMLQKLGNLLLIALLWIVAAFAVDLATTLLENTKMRGTIYENSVVMRRFMDWHQTTEAESDISDNPLLQTLQKTRQWLYDKAGFGHMLDQVDAISQIQAMPDDQRNALINQDENLQNLLNNPDMQAVIHNAEIRSLIEKAGSGDAAALMQLSKHPDINKLFSNTELRQQIMSINPKELMQQKEQLQRQFSGQ